MKKNILNFLIAFLTLSILLIVGYYLYKYITFEKFNVIIKANSNVILNENNITCDFSLHGCIVTLPSFSANNGEAIGYSYNSNDTNAIYKIGDKINISKDTLLYTITSKKKVVVSFAKDYDHIENEQVSCTIYNEDNACKVRLPRFNKIGYQNIGYSTSQDTFSYENSNLVYVEYLPGEEYYVSDNILLYPRYESYEGHKYDINYSSQIYENYLEIEKDVSDYNINMYKKYLEEIHQNAPYLFVNVKINLLTENTFNPLWRHEIGYNNFVTGMSYTSFNGWGRTSKWSTIDIKTNYDILKASSSEFAKNEIEDDYKYSVLVHEMVHTWDHYYGILFKGIKPTEISKSNEQIARNSSYYSEYYDGMISSQSDIKNLYNKYLSMFNEYKEQKKMNSSLEYTGVLSKYSFSNESEFVAEAFTHYYLKYLVPTGKYKNANIPDDIKTTIEKYICIAKNGYHNDGCIN